MSGIYLKQGETLRVVVTFAGREESVSVLPFFSKYGNTIEWWYMEPRRFALLYEHLWEVMPYKREFWTQEQTDKYNEDFAARQELAWREVYHRLFHYVQVKLDYMRASGNVCCYDLKMEKLCRTVTETVLKRFPPTCFKLPDLPFAQEYRSTRYRPQDMEEAGWPVDSAIEYLRKALTGNKDWTRKEIDAYLARVEKSYRPKIAK